MSNRNKMPTEPIKDYPIAKSLCKAGTPAILVDRHKSVTGNTSGGGGRGAIGDTEAGGGVQRTPWAGTTGTIEVGCIPRQGEPEGGSAGGGVGPDSVTGLTGPPPRPGSCGVALSAAQHVFLQPQPAGYQPTTMHPSSSTELVTITRSAFEPGALRPLSPDRQGTGRRLKGATIIQRNICRINGGAAVKRTAAGGALSAGRADRL
ncbi:unnamed protein product [Arctogadus glacialis]